MSDRRHKDDFRPSKDEIRAMSHYWSVALQNIKAAQNREQRREGLKHAKKRKR